jgi:hypothetical protein
MLKLPERLDHGRDLTKGEKTWDIRKIDRPLGDDVVAKGKLGIS